MRISRAATATAAALVALTLSGCGSDPEESSSGDSASESTEQEGEAGSSEAVEIGMEDIAFVDPDQTVPVGTTVTWVNNEDVTHNVVADNGEFESEDLENGDTFEYTFEEPGEYPYTCTYHASTMTGTITVE